VSLCNSSVFTSQSPFGAIVIKMAIAQHWLCQVKRNSAVSIGFVQRDQFQHHFRSLYNSFITFFSRIFTASVNSTSVNVAMLAAL